MPKLRYNTIKNNGSDIDAFIWLLRMESDTFVSILFDSFVLESIWSVITCFCLFLCHLEIWLRFLIIQKYEVQSNVQGPASQWNWFWEMCDSTPVQQWPHHLSCLGVQKYIGEKWVPLPSPAEIYLLLLFFKCYERLLQLVKKSGQVRVGFEAQVGFRTTIQ